MQVSFLGLLGLAFIVLKLTGYIYWSWWYVTMPRQSSICWHFDD